MSAKHFEYNGNRFNIKRQSRYSTAVTFTGNETDAYVLISHNKYRNEFLVYRNDLTVLVVYHANTLKEALDILMIVFQYPHIKDIETLIRLIASHKRVTRQMAYQYYHLAKTLPESKHIHNASEGNATYRLPTLLYLYVHKIIKWAEVSEYLYRCIRQMQTVAKHMTLPYYMREQYLQMPEKRFTDK